MRTGYSTRSFSLTLVRHPFTVLNQAINDKRWFEGVTLSVVYLERQGIRKLREYFESKDVPAEAILRNLRLGRASQLLESFAINDQPIHAKIGQVNAFRNKVVHEIREPDVIDAKEAKATIERAIECLRALGVS